LTDGSGWGESWDDLEHLISDLKSDGYSLDAIESDTSFAAPEKTFCLEVSRDDSE